LWPKEELEQTGWLKLSLLTLCSTWLAWYVLFSIGWVRHLMPVVYLGSPFLSAMLHDFTDGFKFSTTMRKVIESIRLKPLHGERGRALVATIFVAYMCPITLGQWYRAFPLEGNRAVVDVAEYLNTHASDQDLIETYDAELFFLLNRPYHYPPDEMNLELILRESSTKYTTGYDPLKANPTYLVIGWFSRAGEIYISALNSNKFHRVYRSGLYDVYRRVGRE
jgi:hypothetical protein